MQRLTQPFKKAELLGRYLVAGRAGISENLLMLKRPNSCAVILCWIWTPIEYQAWAAGHVGAMWIGSLSLSRASFSKL